MQNFYDILGVAKNASPEAIKTAYKKLAIQLHPDKNPGNADAEFRFKMIAESYDILGNSTKKAKYDRALNEAVNRPKPAPVYQPQYQPPRQRKPGQCPHCQGIGYILMEGYAERCQWCNMQKQQEARAAQWQQAKSYTAPRQAKKQTINESKVTHTNIGLTVYGECSIPKIFTMNTKELFEMLFEQKELLNESMEEEKKETKPFTFDDFRETWRTAHIK